MRMFKSIAVAAALSLALSLMPVAAHAEKVLKLSHLNKNDPFDNGTGAMATVFKSLVEAGTNGSIKVVIFPDGQLGKDNEVIQQVKTGVVQSSISSVGGIASVYPMIGVLDMPFAYPNIAVTYDVFDGPFGKSLAADITKKQQGNRDANSKPSLALQKYAGIYSDFWYGTVSITSESAGLLLRLDHTPHSEADLLHWQYDTFKAHWRDRTIEDAFVTFALKPDGAIDHATMVPVSSLADFSFDYQDLWLTPAKTENAATPH